MSLGEQTYSAMVHHSQYPSKDLCIDTRSARSIERRPNVELFPAKRAQSCSSRCLPLDKVWFHNSHSYSSNKEVLNQRAGALSFQRSNRNCRIISPFKQWPQNDVQRRSKAPEPAAKIREEVITNMKKYHDLVFLEDEGDSEQFALKSRMSKQGRLQPLLGRPRLPGPSIKQCIGIQPKFRPLGSMPKLVHSVEEWEPSTQPLPTGHHRSLTIMPTKSEVLRNTTLIERDRRLVEPAIDDVRSSAASCDPPRSSSCDNDAKDSEFDSADTILNEEAHKYSYRVVHFATYDPNEDDIDEEFSSNQKMIVQIKKRISSSLSIKSDGFKEEVKGIDSTKPEHQTL